MDPARALDPTLYADLIGRVSAWGRSYLAGLPDRPVRTPTSPGQTLARLPAHPPEHGLGTAGWDDLIRDLGEIIEPGLVHWQHPGFFAFFSCNASAPAIAAELASATLNTNGMLWATSPSATELEMRMMDWCAELFGLPDAFRFDARLGGGGVIQATASEATLAALIAARHRAVRAGVPRDRITVYTSTQAHSSVVKAAMVAGLADDPDDGSRVRLIGTDDRLRMDPGELEDRIGQDLADGLCPALVVATLGTTSTGAMDPLADIAPVLDGCERRPWLHVDAAWAGAAFVCPEHRAVAAGLDHADSVCINPHKWLLTNFDCDLFWVRDAKALTDSMAITPAYLRDANSDAGTVVDYRDWHVPLGRRLRALKLWWVIRHYGADGLRQHIRRHIAMAERIETALRADPRLELPLPRSLALVCFRVRGDDRLTDALVARVNASGRVLITPTRVPIGADGSSAAIARVSVGTTTTDDRAVDALLSEIRTAADSVVQSSP
ncbi:MAG: aspartate aminotransferase family protein [Planctomycetota bacterium]|nr:MAG: aspartate aminotransferase family protein [Planctomycetota bacterium]